jgi:hypothetical protein
MNADRTVQATFTRLWRLSVSVSVDNTTFGNNEDGAVTASPSGLSPNPCRLTDSGFINCTGQYLNGTVVTLSWSGYGQFNGWGGHCTGTPILASCRVTMDRDTSVSASFN